MQSQRASCAMPNTETLWPQESELRKLSGLPVYVLEGLFVQCAHPMVSLDYLLSLCKCPICILNSSLSQWGLLMYSLDFDFSVNSCVQPRPWLHSVDSPCATSTLISQCGLPCATWVFTLTVWTPCSVWTLYFQVWFSRFGTHTHQVSGLTLLYIIFLRSTLMWRRCKQGSPYYKTKQVSLIWYTLSLCLGLINQFTLLYLIRK